MTPIFLNGHIKNNVKAHEGQIKNPLHYCNGLYLRQIKYILNF